MDEARIRLEVLSGWIVISPTWIGIISSSSGRMRLIIGS